MAGCRIPKGRRRFIGGKRAVEGGRADAARASTTNLILHEGDEGRDDETESAGDERRDLEADRLAAAGREDGQHVVAVEDGADDAALYRPKCRMAIVALKEPLGEIVRGGHAGRWRTRPDRDPPMRRSPNQSGATAGSAASPTPAHAAGDGAEVSRRVARDVHQPAFEERPEAAPAELEAGAALEPQAGPPGRERQRVLKVDRPGARVQIRRHQTAHGSDPPHAAD